MSKLPLRRLAAALFAASCMAGVSTAALAQAAPAPSQNAPSQNAMVNLVRALVAKGTLDAATGQALIQQAEAEARQAQAQSTAAAPRTGEAIPTAPGAALAAAEPAGEGQHIQYVPQIVKDQLKDEVRDELAAEARQKGWIAPNALPDWVHRVSIGGDFRVRGEGDFFSRNNASGFTNVNAIDAGGPFNIDSNTNPNNPPTLNSEKPREYADMRFRLAIDAQVAGDVDFHGRLASGTDNQPVSTNQTLGGYFTKDAIWLDRAFVDWHPVDGLHIFAGRMQNPFRASDLVWDEDVNPDGFAATYERRITDRFTAYLTGSAFSLDYVAANSPTDATGAAGVAGDAKVSDDQSKFIYAIQGGGAFQVNDRLTAHLNGDYYYYANVQGALSPACLNTADYCLTDTGAPGYLQKGNSVFALRNLVALDPTNTASPQLFGLASKFKVLEFSGDLAFRPSDDLKLMLSANFAENLGYNRNAILRHTFNPDSNQSQIANNLICTADLTTSGGVCPSGDAQFQSGNKAFQVRVSVGSPQIVEAGDWGFSAMYKYIEPDALLDAFTDQDFHLGGTNAKGFVLIGTLGIRHNTNVSIRWFDTDQVFGPRFAVDVLQADLNVKF
jgi:hypothetical protein